MNGLFKVMPQPFIRLQNLIIIIFLAIPGGPGVLQINNLLHDPSKLELKVMNWWLDILRHEFLVVCRIRGSINAASRPGPEAAKHPQTITPPPSLTVSMMLFFCRDVTVTSIMVNHGKFLDGEGNRLSFNYHGNRRGR